MPQRQLVRFTALASVLQSPARLPFTATRHTLSRLGGEHPIARSHCRHYCSDMSTLLIIVLLLVLFGGGGGYYYSRRR